VFLNLSCQLLADNVEVFAYGSAFDARHAGAEADFYSLPKIAFVAQ